MKEGIISGSVTSSQLSGEKRKMREGGGGGRRENPLMIMIPPPFFFFLSLLHPSPLLPLKDGLDRKGLQRRMREKGRIMGEREPDYAAGKSRKAPKASDADAVFSCLL